MLLAASTLGTIPGWLTVAGVVAVAWLFYRSGGGTAITTLRDANVVLEHRVHDLERQGKEDAKTIAELRGRTDIATQVAPLMAWATAHEAHAQARHDAELVVLNMIASRMGPDNGG